MATSFAVDPTTWIPGVADLTEARRNIRYGPKPWQVLGHYRHKYRRAGGNPVLICFHGGGFGSRRAYSAIESSVSRHILLAAYLLNPAYGTQSDPWDIVSVEYGKYLNAQASPAAHLVDYEDTIENVLRGSGPVFWPSFAWVADAQRAIQFVKDNATRLEIDALKTVTWGESAGFTIACLAALRPSAAFVPRARTSRRWDVHSDSRVLGVLNFNGVIDLNPWYIHPSVTAFAFGLSEGSPQALRARMERLLLVPDSSGQFPANSPLNAFGTSVSPRAQVLLQGSRPKGPAIQSWYVATDTTTAPGMGYTSVPPYLASGHDMQQFSDLAAACATGSIAHSGGLVQPAAFGGDLQLAYEDRLGAMHAWLNGLIDF